MEFFKLKLKLAVSRGYGRAVISPADAAFLSESHNRNTVIADAIVTFKKISIYTLVYINVSDLHGFHDY